MSHGAPHRVYEREQALRDSAHMDYERRAHWNLGNGDLFYNPLAVVFNRSEGCPLLCITEVQSEMPRKWWRR